MLGLATKSISILFLAVAEVYFFRWFFHLPQIDIRPGLPGFVDADLVLPGFCSFILLLFILEREGNLLVGWNQGWAKANFICVLAFAAVSLGAREWVASGLWWMLFASVVASAVFVRLPPTILLGNRNRLAIFPCAMIASSLVWIKLIYEHAWSFFGVASAQTVCSTLTYLDGKARCQWVNPKLLAIIHPQIQVLMGPPCSGVDALVLFVATTALYIAIDTRRGNVWQAGALFIGGITFAFLLNVFRILCIFGLSLFLSWILGLPKVGTKILVAIFHAHAGWVVYLLGSAFYFIQVERLRLFLEGWRVSGNTWLPKVK